MKDALTIHRTLLEREIAHEIVRLPRPIAHADDLPGALGLPPERCPVTRMYHCLDALRGERFLAALITPAGSRTVLEPVRRALGARLIRPARPDLINSVTDYHADLVCPLLLPDAVPVLIDRAGLGGVAPDEVVYTPTGEPLTALAVRMADLRELSGAKPIGSAWEEELPAARPA
ncbi:MULTISPECIES: aminoacyl-tRNA deacylase [Thermomonospora]|uniref:YbaK/aminoacyl-tRNA synthetase-associated domain-containing protein n=1 Tax=Thermomonospora curvata (strain ATCC 19995 / DSM 43183 / JCM 3096 / KCTC 9072 / NBRC 15933 / NCIMB 10081 / Henssen B9) TaxID=471852 RepID=D1A952_THECD|nr:MULTISPECIES: YbaK/EbsC family protein [Thermomonospora]ACZ00482.1 hypothetical protein Tcur_4967 [Thermomonospora curvata DSM 43183]PKK11861.1 MAG: hypothetical protein BUE48_024020 [Thermomonospora sp. CIF 1]